MFASRNLSRVEAAAAVRSWRAVQPAAAPPAPHSWDIAIDAEYNGISSIVENSIDEENNVDGGFSNLETQKTVITCIMTQ